MKKSTIWHPMTQHKIFPEMIPIDRAEGAYLYTQDGDQILDGISSWWVNTHGHCHPKIVEAVQAQAAKLEQVIFAGFTHAPAEELAERLIDRATHCMGGDLRHVFFSDSGSTAIEVAVKMAVGDHAQIGAPKHKIVALEGGYHGDTIGTMSAGARGVFNETYAPLLFDVSYLKFPHKNHEQETLDQFEALLKGGDIAALVLEPLVQGAAGMQIYSGRVLRGLYKLCKRYGALMIADEVMTGFGRTGSMFACAQGGFAPDLLCLSKGLTGGFLPMGATLCTADIYDAFYHDDRAKQFFHSTSFTGNALACAAALASLDIWRDEPVFDRLQMIETSHKAAAKAFSARDDVTDVRTIGTILALDVRDETDGYLSDLGVRLYNEFLESGILLRPIGNCVYILPPYCITKDELERIYEQTHRSLDGLKNERAQCAA